MAPMPASAPRLSIAPSGRRTCPGIPYLWQKSKADALKSRAFCKRANFKKSSGSSTRGKYIHPSLPSSYTVKVSPVKVMGSGDKAAILSPSVL